MSNVLLELGSSLQRTLMYDSKSELRILYIVFSVNLSLPHSF
jgi:hypothetical protein